VGLGIIHVVGAINVVVSERKIDDKTYQRSVAIMCHNRILKIICFWGLFLFMLLLCLGTGCSKGQLGQNPEPKGKWTCDNNADEAMKRRIMKRLFLFMNFFLRVNLGTLLPCTTLDMHTAKQETI